MVKNKKGGSGHKKMARKNVAPKGGYHNRKLRKPVEEGEIFARVTAIHGGGHAGILCADGKVRTLVIRGKFRGRNKRDNQISINSILLVGLRDWEVVQRKKKEKVDLLYVYDNNQVETLKKNKSQKITLFDEMTGEDIDFDNNDEIFEDIKIKKKTVQEKNKKENEQLKNGKSDIDWDDI